MQTISTKPKMLKPTFVILIITILFFSSCEKDSSRPNILLCIADDASMYSFGAYGDTYINTPAIDALAKEGVVFKNAYNCNPKCSPARACLVTGKYSWQLKEACNHYPQFPEEFALYPQLLMDNGYHVGHTGKGWGPGRHNFEHNPAGPSYSKIKLKAPYKGINNCDYAANFEDFLNKNTENKPFCFWLGTKEPHRFYEKDSYIKEGKKLDDPKVQKFFPDNEIVRGDLLDYAVEVEWYDKHVGKAIELLKEKGLYENTLIIITSDHGMPFPRVKGQIYEEGFHIPFIAVWKNKIKAGTSITDFISFPDVAPTFMEAAGLKPHNQMTGKSFFKLLLSGKNGRIDKTRDHVLLGKERHDIGRKDETGVDRTYPVRAIRNDDYLYVHNIIPERWPVGNPEYGYRNCDGSPTKSYINSQKQGDPDYPFFELCFEKRPEEELYNIKNDPECMHNLANDEKFAQIKSSMRKQMETELIEQEDPRTLGNGEVFENYQYMGRRLDYQTGKSIGFPPKNK